MKHVPHKDPLYPPPSPEEITPRETEGDRSSAGRTNVEIPHDGQTSVANQGDGIAPGGVALGGVALDERIYYNNVASTGDMTGLIPSQPVTEGESESYEQLYGIPDQHVRDGVNPHCDR